MLEGQQRLEDKAAKTRRMHEQCPRGGGGGRYGQSYLSLPAQRLMPHLDNPPSGQSA